MNAAQHAKVWRGAEKELGEAADEVKAHRRTYELFQSLRIMVGLIAKHYEFAAESEKENP